MSTRMGTARSVLPHAGYESHRPRDLIVRTQDGSGLKPTSKLKEYLGHREGFGGLEAVSFGIVNDQVVRIWIHHPEADRKRREISSHTSRKR